MPPRTGPVGIIDEFSGLFTRRQRVIPIQKSNSDIENQPPYKRLRRDISNHPFSLQYQSLKAHASTTSAAESRSSLKQHPQSSEQHRVRIPQYVDCSTWPGVAEWMQCLLLNETPNDIQEHILKNDIEIAWEKVVRRSYSFLEIKLFPFFDRFVITSVLDNNDPKPKQLVMAFMGLSNVLHQIDVKIRELFSISDVIIADITEVYSPSDIFEEIDLGFFEPVHHAESATGVDSDGESSERFTARGFCTPSDAARANPISKRLKAGEAKEVPFRRSLLSDCGYEGNRSETFHTARETVMGDEPISTSRMYFDSELICPEGIISEEVVFHMLINQVQKHFWRLTGAMSPLDHHLSLVYDVCLSILNGSRGWDAEMKDAFLAEVDLFHHVIFELELAEQVLVPSLQVLCDKRIKEHVAHCINNESARTSSSDGDKGNRHLGAASFQSLSSFLHSVFQQDSSGECASLELITSLVLEYATQEYIHAVIDSFFDLLLQWPKSRQNFTELKELMDNTSQDVVHGVILSLQRQFRCKLLRPGLNTLDILAVYTAAIRALRIIDPSRVIQDLVCEPVRIYLRSRPDTVRCIMSHITHISSSRDSNHRKTTLPALDVMIEEEEAALAQTMHNVKNSISDIDMENWKSWQPDPVYAELLPTSARTDRQADTIELLMSIYGGQDVFINEYQLILAEKLLGYYSFDSEEETKHLRMMTKRFGESLLQKSDVMSRDAADSQKFHQRILEQLELSSGEKRIPLGIPVSALVISHNYWPEIRTEKLRMPAVLEAAMVKYKQHFEEISLTRTVDPRPELGHVNFDLILDDGRKMNVKCNPVYAAIILKFVDHPKWPLDDLAESLGISSAHMKRKLNYWQRRNVLEESEPDVFSIVAEGSFLSEDDLRRMEDEEIESAVRYVAENNQDEQNVQLQLQMFWKYMTTVLNNVPTITIDRLFSMIRMFIIRGQTKKDVTIEHLRQYLDAKVRARELVFSNNRYSLPKKDSPVVT